MTGIHSALTASIPDLRSEVPPPVPHPQPPQPSNNQLSQGQEREEEGGSEDIVTEVDNVLGKLMASLQKGNSDHIHTNKHMQTHTRKNTYTHKYAQKHTRKHKNTHNVDNVLGKVVASLF